MPAAFTPFENAKTLFLLCFVFIALPRCQDVVNTYAAPLDGSKTPDETSSRKHEHRYASYELQQPMSGRDLAPQMPMYDWDPAVVDDGWKWGNAIVVNRCKETFIVSSIGGWRLGGPRSESTGYGAKEELIQHRIAPGENYTEGFRSTYIAADRRQGYNPDTDKLYGQGISIKIAWANGSYTNNITQLEYALTIDDAIKSSFYPLWLDVSLLDCGQTHGFNLTDFTATEADYQRKTMWCPGYQGGMSLKFEPIEGGNVTCEGFKCQGKCPDMYMFDRTREGEPSKVCTDGFRGNMMLSLCDASG
ncbi:hypothetical protein PTMSG1_00490 [Pyrenophora teres f. maculata]|nr:hypothetical protein PTMSG1_00490 [Pyrenophora teres f. maculata]